MIRILSLLAIACLGIVGREALAADPIISDVEIVQRTDGSRIVDILYDISDADGDALEVSVQLSNNNGASWDLPALNLSGDVGPGVVSGPGKSIAWDLSVLPEEQVGTTYRARIVASDQGVSFAANSPRHTAIMDFSTIDWSDPENIEKYSRADLLQIMASNVWEGGANGDVDALAQIRALNPDIKIVGYVSVKSAQLSGEFTSSDLFWQEWFSQTRPYWALTTVGDTVQDFPNNVVLNILVPECRQAMVETIVEFQRNSANQLDGIFWDYFNTALWIPDSGVDVVGDPDLDGDGIGHWSDPDEMAAYRDAQISLIEAVRDSMGNGYLQIFNGQRAYRDLTFAGLADGLVFELFPTLHFPDPDMANALDPAYQYSLWNIKSALRTVNGEPYMVLTNPWRNFYIDHNQVATRLETGNQFRIVALLVGAFACWNTNIGGTFDYVYGWPEVPVSLGPPTGAPTFEGEFIRRDFANGRIELEMGSGKYPNPFNYRIWELGQIVEELAIPYHFP